MRDRIKSIRSVPANSLVPNPQNWRIHGDAQRHAMSAILDEVGNIDVLKVVETAEGLMLVDGHLRTELIGTDEVRVAILDLTEEEQRKVLATFDPIAALADTDHDLYRGLADSIETDSDALRELLDSVAPPLLEDTEDDEVAASELLKAAELENYKPITEIGQVWELGRHRLMCGDAIEETTPFIEGREVKALFTDPPYGINRDPAWLDGVRTHRRALASRERLAGDDGSLDLSFLYEFPRRMIWGFPYIADPDATGWVVWDKQPGVEGRGIVTPIEMASTTMRKGFDMVRCMWGGYYRAAGEERFAHPTQKPTKVVEPFIEAWIDEGQVLLDPFLGSGTTMIAAERLNRVCYGIEIEPRYCDVAIKRWETYTGQKAKLVSKRRKAKRVLRG